jgi:ABC-2 type transport system ATP-binding protein
MADAAIRTRDLCKDYHVGFWRPRPYRALDHLSIEVAAGDVFGFLGPNGAGKTTTLKLLMQLVFPTSGEAEILGRPAGDVGVRRRIGYLPENPYFYDHLTAEELLDYYGRLFGMTAADRRTRIPATLDRLGIGAERRLALRKFSKGMLQRVGLAQAVLNDPEVLFLDEPMSGLDPLGRRDVRALMLELRDQGRTIFFSSHILSDAEALCSQVAIVAKGRLAAAGRLTDLQEFAIQGWEAGDGRRARRGARARAARAQPDPDGRGRSLRDRPAAGRAARGTGARADRRGAALISVNPLRETLEDVFVRRVAEMGDGAGAEAEGEPRTDERDPLGRRRGVPRVRPRPRVLQPRPLRRAAGRRVDPDRPADRRPGREDHQGSRPGGDVALRPLHRRLRRHQPRCRRRSSGRSVYPLFAKPIRRAEFILGKYAGLLLTLLANMDGHDDRDLRRAVLPLARRPAEHPGRRGTRPAMDPALLEAIALIYFNLAVVTAVALVLLDVFQPDALRRLHDRRLRRGQFNADLKHFDVDRRFARGRALREACYYVLPDFAKFDVKLAVVHGIPVSGAYLASTAAYAAMYIAALLFGAMMIFSRRDFK